MKAKKLISLLLVIVMLTAVFTACGSKPDEAPVNNPDGAAAAKPAENQSGSKKDQMHLGFFHWKGEE